ncbi:hypothetical protein OFAG_02170 [Oxalobacter formigenes HOxBLS]|uniref:Uncharacterized protein n=1 Tax=Oxalobacter paraformigenes TaxID=556268 RepID=T5LEH9_9BURK|nr:hypothetical protein OFAG_02170 [Oxalobacter paraformigenes]
MTGRPIRTGLFPERLFLTRFLFSIIPQTGLHADWRSGVFPKQPFFPLPGTPDGKQAPVSRIDLPGAGAMPEMSDARPVSLSTVRFRLFRFFRRAGIHKASHDAIWHEPALCRRPRYRRRPLPFPLSRKPPRWTAPYFGMDLPCSNRRGAIGESRPFLPGHVTAPPAPGKSAASQTRKTPPFFSAKPAQKISGSFAIFFSS